MIELIFIFPFTEAFIVLLLNLIYDKIFCKNNESKKFC